MTDLPGILGKVRDVTGVELPAERYTGFLSKKLTESSSIAIKKENNGYHIEVTNPKAEMLVFPVVTSAKYEFVPQEDPNEKRRYYLRMPTVLYRANLEALLRRCIDHFGTLSLRHDKSFYENELARISEHGQETLPSHTHGTFAIRGNGGQRQLEIGIAREDGRDFLTLRACLVPGDHIVFLQCKDGKYDVVGMPKESVADADWTGWAASPPSRQVVGGDAIMLDVSGTEKQVVSPEVTPPNAGQDVANALAPPAVLTAIEPSAGALQKLLEEFEKYLNAQALVFDRSTIADMLACMLGSQFLLFAGPSGTGKSTAARALAQFFALEDHWQLFEARRQLIGAEDFVGYYSAMADDFITTPDMRKLLALDTRLLGGADREVAGPVFIVEEANLSPIEGYLSPLFHGLSRPAVRSIHWALHSAAGDVGVPSTVELAPYARLVGTVNADATSPAPAKKVSARACIVVLEPSDEMDVGRLVESLPRLGPEADTRASEYHGAGARHLQSPAAALLRCDAAVQTALSQRLIELVESLLGGSDGAAADVRNVVSTRDLQRCLMYMAYFRLLAGSDGDMQRAEQVAAENAVLHFVLPALPAELFSDVVRRALSKDFKPALEVVAGDAKTFGGLLRSRLERLGRTLNGPQGILGAVDFWSALS